MLKMQTLCILVSVLAILLLSSWSEGAVTNERAEIVLLQQHANLTKITSLSFTAQSEMKPSPAQRESAAKRLSYIPDKLCGRLIFNASGLKFRSEVVTGEGSLGNARTAVWAYDGRHYQLLKGNKLVVGDFTNSRNPYGAANPLLVPFTFAFADGSPMTLSHLQAETTWSRLAATVTACKEAEVNNHSGIELTMNIRRAQSEESETYVVFFAEDLDYFPLRWKAPGPAAGGTTVLDVKSTEIVGEDADRIVIPVETSSVAYAADGTILQSINRRIDVDSLQVNSPLRDALFAIQASEAKELVGTDILVK